MRQYKDVLKVILFLGFIHCGFVSSRVTATLYVLHNGQPAWTVGCILSLYAFLPALLAVHAGKWIDKIGTRIPIIAAVLMIGGACLIPIFFSIGTFGLWPLLLMSTLAGTGFLFAQIAGQGLIGCLSTVKNRATAFTFQAMAFSVSASIGPLISGYLIDHGSYTWAFGTAFGLAAIGGSIFLGFSPFLPNYVSPRRKGASQQEGVFALLKIPRVRNVLIGSGLVSMAWDLQQFMIPVYGTEIGLDAVAIGWLLSTFSVCTFAVRLFMPFLSRVFREWQIIIAVILISGCIFMFFPFIKSLPILFIFCGILGMSLGASQPNVLSLLHQVSPAGRVGEAIGLRSMFTNGSHTVFPLLFGVGGTVIGAATAFWSLGAVMLGGGAYLRKVRKHPELNEPEEIKV
ncbi:MAG: MFS transporter [Burkholderiales bacterium]|nr:MFS transporter [Burkholderiales bacterium]